jgi:hypothetical protein
MHIPVAIVFIKVYSINCDIILVNITLATSVVRIDAYLRKSLVQEDFNLLFALVIGSYSENKFIRVKKITDHGM